MTSRSRLPLLNVFSLGGTIASTGRPTDDASGVVPTLTAMDLVAAVPQIADVATVDATSFRMSSSADLSFADVHELAEAIEGCLTGGSDGVVVTQGTDTLEETAFILSQLLDHPRPVVVTGAMRNPTLAGGDGPANLLAALQLAASPAAEGVGCVVVFNDEIHDPRFVRKTHTANVAAFSSTPAGPIGWISEGEPTLISRPARSPRLVIDHNAEFPAVALLTISLGDDGRLIEAIGSLPYRGLVIEALGGGHVPTAMVAPLERVARDIPVVLASRTGGGQLLSKTYGFPGSETDLLARGLLSAGLLDGPKSRALLTLLLATGMADRSLSAEFGRRSTLPAS